MSASIRFLLALVLLALGSVASAALPPSISGSWYDPAHAGHGLSIEVLDDTRAIAYWFVYDPDGRPLHLYVDGRIVDRRIEGPAYSGRGMRFGAFDPRDHRLQRWGQVSIEFDSCDAARLAYDANGEAGVGFGTGTIALERLASVGQLGCAPNTLPALRTGVYSGSYTDDDGIVRPFHGYVAPDGRLHATGEIADAATFQSGQASPVVIADAARYRDGVVTAEATAWAAREPDATPEPALARAAITYREPGVVPQFTGTFDSAAPWRSFTLGFDAARTAAAARSLASVPPNQPRRYATGLRADGRESLLESTHSLCLYRESLILQCADLYAEIRRPASNFGTFAAYVPAPLRTPIYRGVTWVEFDGDAPARLFAVGTGGYGLVMRVKPGS